MLPLSCILHGIKCWAHYGVPVGWLLRSICCTTIPNRHRQKKEAKKVGHPGDDTINTILLPLLLRLLSLWLILL